MKVLQTYSAHPNDSLKLKAAIFLIRNMSNKYTLKVDYYDATGKVVLFNVFDYCNPSRNDSLRLLKNQKEPYQIAFDSINSARGGLTTRSEIVMDYNSITSSYLIENIELAFKVWKEMPWAKHLNFDQFCEYILPYRVVNEPIENWREPLFNFYKSIRDSLSDPYDPKEACTYMNKVLFKFFTYDDRANLSQAGYNELMKYKMGNCTSRGTMAIYAMRAIGIPVAIDFNGYWAHYKEGHIWGSLLNRDGSSLSFEPCDEPPGVHTIFFRSYYKIAKVYRQTYACHKNSLNSDLNSYDNFGGFLYQQNYTDVTSSYIPVIDIKMRISHIQPKFGHAYICVFNGGQWKPIHWANLTSAGDVTFTGMGKNIIYCLYYNGSIASQPFTVKSNGEVTHLIPDYTHKVSVTLKDYTFWRNADMPFKPGEDYELNYWDNEWKYLARHVANNTVMKFENLPANALYRINYSGLNYSVQRPFIVENDKVIWW